MHEESSSIIAVIKQIYVVLLALTSVTVEGRPSRKLSSTVCVVADSIQLHNSSKKWWWSPNRSTPVIASRPMNSHAGQEWVVYVTTPSHWGTTVAEFAHKTTDGHCRFLVRRPNSDSIHFGRPSRCRPHQNGRGSYFTISLDLLSNREQIMAGIGRDFESSDNVFLGVKGKSLHVNKLRSPFMRWWKINFNNRKNCSKI